MLKQIYFSFFLLIPLVGQTHSTLERIVVGEISPTSSTTEGLRRASPFARPQPFQQDENWVNTPRDELFAWEDPWLSNQAEALASLNAKIEQMQRDLSALRQMLDREHGINT